MRNSYNEMNVQLSYEVRTLVLGECIGTSLGLTVLKSYKNNLLIGIIKNIL